MGLWDIFSTTEPVVAAGQPLISADNVPASQQRTTTEKAPWQDRARRAYWSETHAIDVAIEFVDLRSNLGALYPAKAKHRDLGNTWVTVDDPALQTLVDQWRNPEGSQAALIRDIIRERTIVGEYVHRTMTDNNGMPRFQCLSTDQVHDREQWVDGDGTERVLVQLRTSAGQRPRKGEDVEGRWAWVPKEDLVRRFNRGRMSYDADSPLRHGLRYLDRIMDIEAKMFEAFDSYLMMSKILAVTSDPNLGKDDADPVAASYYGAAKLTREDRANMMGKVPLFMRLQDPGAAQILDLGGEITSEDIESLRFFREQFASAMPAPKQALLEGAGASQRNLNNYMLDEGLHQECVQPAVTEAMDDGTETFLRPTLRRIQETTGMLADYEVEDLAMGWDPIDADLRTAGPDVIMRAYQIGLTDYAETTALLGTRGWSSEDRPGVSDFELYLLNRQPTAVQQGPGVRDLLEGWGDPEPVEIDRAPAEATLVSGW